MVWARLKGRDPVESLLGCPKLRLLERKDSEDEKGSTRKDLSDLQLTALLPKFSGPGLDVSFQEF